MWVSLSFVIVCTDILNTEQFAKFDLFVWFLWKDTHTRRVRGLPLIPCRLIATCLTLTFSLALNLKTHNSKHLKSKLNPWAEFGSYLEAGSTHGATRAQCDVMKTRTHRETNGIALNEQQRLLMAAQGKSSKTKHSADSQNRERGGETWDPSCNLKTHGRTHDLISFCIPPNEIMSDVTANQARAQVLFCFFRSVIVPKNT